MKPEAGTCTVPLALSWRWKRFKDKAHFSETLLTNSKCEHRKKHYFLMRP